jgi:hypothetical protein
MNSVTLQEHSNTGAFSDAHSPAHLARTSRFAPSPLPRERPTYIKGEGVKAAGREQHRHIVGQPIGRSIIAHPSCVFYRSQKGF